MSSSAAWAGLAGLMQGIGSGMKQRDDDEKQAQKDAQKEKLLQLQQDAEQKRQQFLIDYKVKAEGAADEEKQKRHAGDVDGTVTNPETGDVMGRTKGGTVVPLVTTSDDYKAQKAAQLTARVENTTALAHNRQDANKGPANPAYGSGQPAPDAAPQSTSPSQPGAPSMEDIIAQANAAVKRGAPQDAVEAKMKALMQQYGYQPQ